MPNFNYELIESAFNRGLSNSDNYRTADGFLRQVEFTARVFGAIRLNFERVPALPENPNTQSTLRIESYNYRPRRLNFVGAGPLYLGVELEIEHPDTDGAPMASLRKLQLASRAVLASDTSDDTWYLKHDGSLRNGFEIVTHPMGIDVQRKLWAELYPHLLDRDRFAMSERTGLHIHVSRKALSTLQTVRLTEWLDSRAYIDMATLSRIAGRRMNRYSEPRNRKLGNAYRTQYGMEGNNRFFFSRYDRCVRSDADRYSSINLNNEKTVEFRMFQGTLEINQLLSYFDFVESALEYTKEQVNSNWPGYFNWLKGKEWKWPALTRRLVDLGIIDTERAFKLKQEFNPKVRQDRYASA